MKRVDIVLGVSCNQNCKFCFNKALNEKLEKFKFPFFEVKKVLEKGAEEGISRVSISGGEPTISSDFHSTLELAHNLGYKDIRIVTNGMMFYYDSFAKKCLKKGITHICVSLHANSKELHDKMTEVPGSFLKVLRGLKNIKKYIPNAQLTAHVVLTKEIIEILKDHISFLIEKGFDAVNFLYLMPNSKLNWELIPDKTHVAEVLKEIIDLYKDKMYIHIGYLEPCTLKGYEQYFDVNDFDMEFMSNCNALFDGWKQTLIDNKIMDDKCLSCSYRKTCMGHWKQKNQ